MGKANLSRISGIRFIILLCFLSIFLFQQDTAHAGFSATLDGSGTVNFTGSDSFPCVVPGMEGNASSATLRGNGQLFLIKTYPGPAVELNEKLEISCYALRTYTFSAVFAGGKYYSGGNCVFAGYYNYSATVTLDNTPGISINVPDRISKKQPSNIDANYNFPEMKESCYDASINTDRCKARTASLYIDGSWLLIRDDGFGSLGVSGTLTYTFDPAKTPLGSGFHTVRATAGCVSTSNSVEKTVYVEPEDDCTQDVGLPVNVASGNVKIDKTDFTLKGLMPVEFTRYYNSGGGALERNGPELEPHL